MRRKRNHSRSIGELWQCAILVVTALLTLPGCAPKVKPPELAEFPILRELVDRHNQRVAALEKTYSQGVIELNWIDAEGDHFEQASLEMWLQHPLRTAVRIEKFSEVILWLGSDDQRWWLFDLISKEKSLTSGPHQSEGTPTSVGAFGVRPAALIDLLGLTPLAQDTPPDDRAGYDAVNDSWIVDAVGQGGAMRVHFHRKLLLPVRVEHLDASGRVAVYSELAINRYQSARVPGIAAIRHPKMPGLIDVRGVPSNPIQGERPAGSLDGWMKIALNETTGVVDETTMQRVFDLERLSRAMRVDRVETLP